MAQFLRPSGDTSIDTWTTAPLFAKINEVVPADASFIESASNPVNGACELALSAGKVPFFTPATLRYRYAKDAAAGRTIDLTVRLLEGATILDTFVHAAITEVPTQANQDIRSFVNDWTNVRVSFSANVSGAGGARKARVSWCELEIGDSACPFIRTADLSHIIRMLRSPALFECKEPIIRALVAYAATGATERAAMERAAKAIYEALEGRAYDAHQLKHWIIAGSGDSGWEI